MAEPHAETRGSLAVRAPGASARHMVGKVLRDVNSERTERTAARDLSAETACASSSSHVRFLAPVLGAAGEAMRAVRLSAPDATSTRASRGHQNTHLVGTIS